MRSVRVVIVFATDVISLCVLPLQIVRLIVVLVVSLLSVTTSVDFGITQVVDGNWGVHADIPKWVFDKSDAPFDYSCTTSMGPGRRHLKSSARRELLQSHGVEEPFEDHARTLFEAVGNSCDSCGPEHATLAEKLLDAKLRFAEKRMMTESMLSRVFGE